VLRQGTGGTFRWPRGASARLRWDLPTALLFNVPLISAATSNEAPWREQADDSLGAGANALRGGGNLFFALSLSLSCYAKMHHPMHCLLETRIDVHIAQCELFLHLHTPLGVSLGEYKLMYTELNVSYLCICILLLESV
jgi:hypothetical protein